MHSSLCIQNEDSPLHFAAGNGHSDCTQILVDNKANLDIQNKVSKNNVYSAIRLEYVTAYEPLNIRGVPKSDRV